MQDPRPRLSLLPIVSSSTTRRTATMAVLWLLDSINSFLSCALLVRSLAYRFPRRYGWVLLQRPRSIGPSWHRDQIISLLITVEYYDKLLTRLFQNPVLVKAYDRSIVEFLIQGPRFHTIVVIASKPLSLISGNVDNSVHAVISFPRPGGDPTDHFVVNMSRTQYGNSGRGTYGETYFLGTWDQYTDSMMATEEEKKICDDFTDIRRSHEMNMQPGANRDRLEACAKRVCERWQNREAQGWCAYCGKGGKLLRCSWCKTAKVWYCCKEYQVSDRKLHKHTCEGIKT